MTPITTGGAPAGFIAEGSPIPVTRFDTDNAVLDATPLKISFGDVINFTVSALSVPEGLSLDWTCEYPSLDAAAAARIGQALEQVMRAHQFIADCC